MTRRARRTDDVPTRVVMPPAKRARLDTTPIDLPRSLPQAGGTDDDSPDPGMTEERLDPETPAAEPEPEPEPEPAPPPEGEPPG